MKIIALIIVAVLLAAVACTAGLFYGYAKVTLVDEKPAEITVTEGKRCFILDTDWLSDVDDAVAVRYLTRKHLSGEITLLGININAPIKTSGPSLDSFVSNEGIRLPIAVDHEATKYGIASTYHTTAIRHGGGSIYATSLEYTDSVVFYRKTLASLPEGVKADIISLGFMNSLARLLNSPADEYSPLTGSELVAERVGTLWAMAGQFPEGKEFNIRRKPLSVQSAASICENWVTPIVFLGYECGNDVKTGGTIRGELGRGDLLYRCLLAHFSPNGRSSWDPMTAYLAVIGSPEDAGFSTVAGKVKVLSDGRNEFVEDSAGKHCYVVKQQSNEFYMDKIDEVIAAEK